MTGSIRILAAIAILATRAAHGQSATTSNGAARTRPAPDTALFTSPYLQLGATPPSTGADASVTLMWHTFDKGARWAVDVQRKPGDPWATTRDATYRRVEAAALPAHRVYAAVLQHIIPGVLFRYRLRRDGRIVFAARARAGVRPGHPYRFVVFGDCGVDSPSQRMLAYLVWRTDPDFVALTGDVAYTGGRLSEYRTEYFPIYNAQLASGSTGAPLLRSRPFFTALGNGDIRAIHVDSAPRGHAADGLGYFAYWALPRNGPIRSVGAPNAPPISGDSAKVRALLDVAGPSFPQSANYSFDYGSAHWTVLDMNPYVDWADTTMRSWLERDLMGARGQTWRFVVLHQAGFSSGHTHYADQQMRLVADLFERYHVDLVFAGHDHTYQRSRPLFFHAIPDSGGRLRRPDGTVRGDFVLDSAFDGRTTTTPHGVIYIVSGAGGAALYDSAQTANPPTWQPFTVTLVADVHSFTVVDVNGTALVLRQVSETGAELDRVRVTRETAAPPP